MRILQGDCIEVLKTLEDNSIDSVVTDPPYGLSFMGKKWDYDVPTVDMWQECIRVLKPGGYLLSFAGTRTQHRMAVNIEDAGFEIRDMIAWVYGSGFPKSLNIGKAVDKLQGNERKDVGKYICPDGKERKHLGGAMMPNAKGTGIIPTITKGTSEYEGWGTALKPALEPITVARKPLSEKTVAKNVLKWGTGGINIDGCRVGTEDKLERVQGNNKDTSTPNAPNNGWKSEPQTQGRFPANFIHDGSDEVVSGFPETKAATSRTRRDFKGWKAVGELTSDSVYQDGGGSASRFFYCAKASKSERNKGLEGFEEKRDTDRNNDSIALSNRLHNKTNLLNNHPTVKPVALMQYLVKLVTPKEGIVLDPFMGSGTTGIACKQEGFDFIGIEKEQEYIKIAEARIEAVKPQMGML